jgi:hypothetical protein
MQHLLWGLVLLPVSFGFALGYGFREIISRRRRLVARRRYEGTGSFSH